MPYLQALLSESVKLMFSQYESDMILQECFKYITANYFIVLFLLAYKVLSTLIYKLFFLLPYKI